MVIGQLYLGTWFQRTALHLKEVYRFLEQKQAINILSQTKINELWKNLKIISVSYYETEHFDMVEAKTDLANISITEDGIMLLKVPTSKDILKDMKNLEAYYLNNFSPAISYLFSKGAPLPKELSKLKEVYPIYLVGFNLSNDACLKTMKNLGEEVFSSVSKHGVKILFGESRTLINVERRILHQEKFIDELVQNIVFFREFERQLNSYLVLHRILWEGISKVRNSEEFSYKDLRYFRDILLEYMETLSFVKTRLAQMKDIILTRSALLSPRFKRQLEDLGIERFSLFRSAQEYIGHLWEMTMEYAESTLDLIKSAISESSERELKSLRFLTLMGVLVGFFGMNIAFPWETRWPEISYSSFAVFALVLVAAVLLYYGLKVFVYNRKFALHKRL